MGNITGAMVFQSTIPTSSRWCSPRSRGRSTEDSYIAFASAGIAFLAVAAIFVPMARPGRLAAATCSSAGVFYLVYLALVPRRDPSADAG